MLIPLTPSAKELIKEKFKKQKKQSLKNRKNFTFEKRREALKRLYKTLVENEKRIVFALKQDLNKPDTEALITEIVPTYQELRYTLKNLNKWMKPIRVCSTSATLGTQAYVQPQPKGTCLIISSWNYPFSLTISPLISCIAAGNTAIVKPSEMTPRTSAILNEIISESFNEDIAQVIEGNKHVSQYLLSLPFDHIFFTGSPNVGRLVMESASKNLSSVTLELGGKSPTIVGPNADLNQTVQWVAFGKFINAGQTCIAPDYLFIHNKVKDKFIEKFIQHINETHAHRYLKEELTHIVNETHSARLKALLEDAKQKGAKILLHGKSEDKYMSPTLLTETNNNMDIDHQEIFGPILPIKGYNDIEEVLNYINDRPKPLALYIFDKNKKYISHILDRTQSGAAGVNLTVLHYAHHKLPFGGVNDSGLGSSHGEHGFKAFSHYRSILKNKFSLLHLFFPPKLNRFKKIIPFLKYL